MLGKRLFDGGDPFLFHHDGKYYIYCTKENSMPTFTPEYPFYETCENGMDGIEVHVSDDLIHWKNAGYCLKKGDVVGTRGFWAPEVSFRNGKFYMAYSADEHSAIAVADSPLGPFKTHGKGWLREKPSIDGHILFDNSGVYFYFVDFDNCNRIRVAKMSDDLTRLEHEYEDVLISVSDPWELVDCRVAEGPFVIKHDGKYYLTYSANHTRNAAYAVGYAVSDSPIGPFVKYPGNPIVHSVGNDVQGTGHASFMKLPDCERYICAFHCHNSKESFKPRKVCLAEAWFEKSEPHDILTVGL